MKETLIAFIIALIIGSIINGYQAGGDTNGGAGNPAGAGAGAAPGTSDSGAPTAGTETANAPEIPAVTEANFDTEVIQDKQPVLIDFTRSNCVHCRKMKPILNQLAQEYAGSLKVVQIDVMDNPSLAQKFAVNGVPAFVIVDKGQAEGPFLGEMPKEKLKSLIKPHMHYSVGAIAQPYRQEG